MRARTIEQLAQVSLIPREMLVEVLEEERQAGRVQELAGGVYQLTDEGERQVGFLRGLEVEL